MMNKIPIYDLHSDLLLYLADEDGKETDAVSRSSLPQASEGGVVFQTYALFSETNPKSLQNSQKQLKAFIDLVDRDKIIPLKRKNLFAIASSEKPLLACLAIENASCLLAEDEPFDHLITRFKDIETHIAKVLYVTMTWNGENRFGGGATTEIGLKSDGKALLDYLSGKKVAIDLSHASDQLSYDILNQIDQNHLDIPLIASHSNVRKVEDVKRNLPDELIHEVVKRQGLIGLNFVKPFIGGSNFSNLLKHIEYLLQCGAENVICYGADFFYTESHSFTPGINTQDVYFDGFGTAAVYPKVNKMLLENLKISQFLLNNICYHNVKRFFQDKIYDSLR